MVHNHYYYRGNSTDPIKLMQKYYDLVLLTLYCSLIYWLSNQQTLPSPDLFDNEDKFQHLLAYFVMGLFAWRAFGHYISRRERLSVVCFSFCLVYGLSDEWHQSFVVGRDASALDWLADSIGGLLATISALAYTHRKMLS